MRALTSFEQNNLRILTENSVKLALIEPTKTGLKKSIMDATGSVRSFLETNGAHDYSTQQQGPESKVLIPAMLYSKNDVIESRTSLYRPNTKKGDPRIWFSKLTKTVSPNDILGLIWYEDSIHVINLSAIAIEKELQSNSRLAELMQQINLDETQIADELLGLLKKIAARGPIKSMVDADTSVGRTLESALGIKINSSKEPDYKGIEIKSFRDKRKSRKNLFAQVPNWELSKFKSSAEILDNFGYPRGEDFKLYCTVSALNTNSRGLSLRVDTDNLMLKEFSNNLPIGDFVVWDLKQLHSRLLEKHKETFWVAADVIKEDGNEYFVYKEVEHTKKPLVSQFDILLEQGVITVDHLIKRNSKGKVVEKGPLFKIRPDSLHLLFPPSNNYNLLHNDQ